MNPCECCGGPLSSLGRLGYLDWFRCRDCGLDQSQWAGDQDQRDEEENTDEAERDDEAL